MHGNFVQPIISGAPTRANLPARPDVVGKHYLILDAGKPRYGKTYNALERIPKGNILGRYYYARHRQPGGSPLVGVAPHRTYIAGD